MYIYIQRPLSDILLICEQYLQFMTPFVMPYAYDFYNGFEL